MISTRRAINTSSGYGITPRCMELHPQATSATIMSDFIRTNVRDPSVTRMGEHFPKGDM